MDNARLPLALDRKSSESVPRTTISRDSINGGERAVSLPLAELLAEAEVLAVTHREKAAELFDRIDKLAVDARIDILPPGSTAGLSPAAAARALADATERRYSLRRDVQRHADDVQQQLRAVARRLLQHYVAGQL